MQVCFYKMDVNYTLFFYVSFFYFDLRFTEGSSVYLQGKFIQLLMNLISNLIIDQLQTWCCQIPPFPQNDKNRSLVVVFPFWCMKFENRKLNSKFLKKKKGKGKHFQILLKIGIRVWLSSKHHAERNTLWWQSHRKKLNWVLCHTFKFEKEKLFYFTKETCEA